jgi:hypothetical protein
MSNSLTQQDIARAVTNDPALSTDEVMVGDKVVKIIDLSYDDYCLFMAHLQPLLESVFGQVAKAAGIDSSSALGVKDLIKYGGNVLPELALLSVRHAYPDMTVTELKALVKSPFKMANIVVKQIEHNQIIQEITDFFAPILPSLVRIWKNRQA